MPDEPVTATDVVLGSFEGELPGLGKASDTQAFAAVERIVLALKAVDKAHNGDEAVALTARHGLG